MGINMGPPGGMQDKLVHDQSTLPTFLKADLRSLKLSTETFGTKFDTILVDPPWEEYVRRAPGMEHCLMGIKGNIRRNTDAHVIHANCDTDVIVSEEPDLGSCEKPEEMYQLIEHFALGKRRLELFGEDHNIREGWVTVGKSLTHSNFNAPSYASHFRNPNGSLWVGNPFGNRIPLGAPILLPISDEIEELRPKSPINERHGRN
ncbi:MAG: hypothetical protein WDW38_005829 [Sanguina aurantia]